MTLFFSARTLALLLMAKFSRSPTGNQLNLLRRRLGKVPRHLCLALTESKPDTRALCQVVAYCVGLGIEHVTIWTPDGLDYAPYFEIVGALPNEEQLRDSLVARCKAADIASSFHFINCRPSAQCVDKGNDATTISFEVGNGRSEIVSVARRLSARTHPASSKDGGARQIGDLNGRDTSQTFPTSLQAFSELFGGELFLSHCY